MPRPALTPARANRCAAVPAAPGAVSQRWRAGGCGLLLAAWLACSSAQAATAHPVQPEIPAPATAAGIEEQFRRGEQGLALQRLRDALVQRPQDPALRFLHGVLLADLGRADDAAKVYQGLIETFPELPEPYNNLAVLRAAEGQLDNALSLLQSALRLAPDYRTAHENLGDLYLRLALRAYGHAAQGAQSGSAVANKLRQARELTQVR